MLIQLTKTHHEEPKTVFEESNDFIFPTEFTVTKIKSLKLELQSIVISLLYIDDILLEIVGTHFWCKALSFWQFFTRCWWPIAFMYTALYTNHTLLGSKGTTTSNRELYFVDLIRHNSPISHTLGFFRQPTKGGVVGLSSILLSLFGLGIGLRLVNYSIGPS